MIRAFVLFLVLLLAPVAGRTEVGIPQLSSAVTDLTATLNSEQQAYLKQKLLDFENTKGAQLALLIIESTQPETIEQYSIRVAEKWKIGRKESDDGVILLIAIKDRTVRIEVGYGLEGALTDLTSKRIIEDLIIPNFKSGMYFEGISAGLESIMKVINGEPLPQPVSSQPVGEDPGAFIFPIIIITVIGTFFKTFFNKNLVCVLSGIVASLAAMSYLTWPISLFVGLVVYVLVFSGAAGGSGRSGGISISSGSFGSSYSGSGGSFGGGGASGRW